MQFKDLFHKKNILRLLILAVIIFLLLPLIFPEKADFKILKKESIYFHEDSPLPIFPKESALDKYANKFKKFYKVGMPKLSEKQKDMEQAEIIEIEENKNTNQNVDITAEDLFFSDDFEDDIFEANSNIENEQKNNTVNLQKGTVLTQDGLILAPTQEGYYYKDKFYKNGTYPQNTNRRYIEGALSRYHSRIAKNLGKKALYFADENGNLTVSYVNELPNQTSPSIDAYYQNAQSQNQKLNRVYRNTGNENNRYQNTNPNHDITPSDSARVSIKDMHAAYNLANSKIQNGQIGQGIDINKPFQNALVNNFLNNNTAPSNQITPDKPNETPQPAPATPEESETVLAGGQDFAQNYADKIHELTCGSEIRGKAETFPTPSPAPSIGNVFKVIGDGNSVSCDTAPIIIETSSAITGNVSQNSDFKRFTNELNEITSQSEKTDINIISTDRNFYPVASKLNNDETIINSKGEPVMVHIIGPNENEANLSKVLEGITYSITDDISTADKLNDDLADYYTSTHVENSGTHTVLAFPTDDERQVFILADPNNSYWLKNPKELSNLPTQYMEKNGVYYAGVIINKTDIGDLVSTKKTNLLYISDKNYTHYLPNGSALTTIKEDDVKINSLHPEQIQKNTERVKTLTENGQRNLEKAQQKKQQPIEVKDIEKGNRKIK